AAAGLEDADTRDIRIPVGAGCVGPVAAEKRPVVIEHVVRAQLAHPVLRESGIRSLLGVPILFEGRGIGVLHVGTLQPRHFRQEDAQLLQVVADRIGLGIEYARLYEEERAARARSEVEQRRSRFLANVSALLATTLDYEATLRNLARLAVPELGDWCVIHMLGEQGSMRRVRGARVATSGSRRRDTREDLAFTEEVAARAALAVDNVRLYREAQETSRLKDEFLATLSHELRTPLTSVLAWMWMLRRGRLDAPAVER